MKLDDFESVFRSAFKEGFQLDPPTVERALLITDLDRGGADALEAHVKRFLSTIDSGATLAWRTLAQEDYQRDIPSLLATIDEMAPDLVVTYRHLGGRVKDLAHSLGSVLDVVAQRSKVPVLVLPAPDRTDLDTLLGETMRVMVVTDHLTGDSHLVNWALHFAHKSGTILLAHIESQTDFERYADVISKLPGMATEDAADRIRAKLLQMPADYIDAVAAELKQQNVEETIESVVRMGHPLAEYSKLLDEHQVDLLVLNRDDEDQSAMAGLTYALAVELRTVPMLLV